MQAGLSFMVSAQLLFSILCVTSLTPAFQLLNVLETVEVNADKSVIQDSLMYKIKRSSAPDHKTPTVLHQSLARLNRHFCQFVIHVSMNHISSSNDFYSYKSYITWVWKSMNHVSMNSVSMLAAEALIMFRSAAHFVRKSRCSQEINPSVSTLKQQLIVGVPWYP